MPTSGLDVPGPRRIRPVGPQAGHPLGATTLAPATAPLTDEAPFAEHPVHLALRAQVGALVEERRVHLGRSEVAEPLGAEHVDDLGLLCLGERSRMGSPWTRSAARSLGEAVLVTLAAVAPAAGSD
jgi:hypothetical protein